MFALAKFVWLALQANPNIIETLYTDPQHVLFVNRYGERLVAARDNFLSGGWANGSAVMRLTNCAGWSVTTDGWVNPPDHQPTEEEFGGQVVGGRYRFPHSDAERAYRAAMGHWNDYVDWRRYRNPARAESEARYGYDTKHAMHLFRLLRMGEEILRDGIVRVLRPDAEWLLSVRDGALSYEQVIQMAAEHEARLER